MPLRVHVHEQDTFLFARKEGGQIDGGDRLPAAALLVHYGYRAHASLPMLRSLATLRLTVIARTGGIRALPRWRQSGPRWATDSARPFMPSSSGPRIEKNGASKLALSANVTKYLWLITTITWGYWSTQHPGYGARRAVRRMKPDTSAMSRGMVM